MPLTVPPSGYAPPAPPQPFDYSALPSFVKPETLVTFAGGKDALFANASHLKIGNERWRTYILDDIQRRATDTIRGWLIAQMDSFLSFFRMVRGERPVNNDADEWDASFEDHLFTFFNPHFEYVFPDPEKREEQILHWLGRNVEQTALFIENAESRTMLAELLAKSIVAGILDSREKSGQKLAMLGIVAPKSTKAEEQALQPPLAPPAPVTEFPEEWGRTAALGATAVPPPIVEAVVPRAARKRVRSAKSGTVKLEPAFMKQFVEEAGFSQAEFAKILGVAKSTLSNAASSFGLPIDREDGESLVNALNVRVAKINALVGHLHNALIWAEQIEAFPAPAPADEPKK